MVETKPPPPRQFVAFNWLSLAGCTWTEPTSIWPADTILVDGSITEIGTFPPGVGVKSELSVGSRIFYDWPSLDISFGKS